MRLGIVHVWDRTDISVKTIIFGQAMSSMAIGEFLPHWLGQGIEAYTAVSCASSLISSALSVLQLTSTATFFRMFLLYVAILAVADL